MQTDPPKAEPPKRKRRWFQYSLRSLLIFTMVCAVACGWLGKKIERKRKEREAVEVIVKSGGHVWYDCEIEGKWNGQVRVAGPPGPGWLRKLLGEYFFSDVEVVSIGNVPDAEAALVGVRALTQLKTLWLGGAGATVSDAWLVNLTAFNQLEDLSLSNSKVTDAGLESLKDFTQLERLSLAHTEVTDAGLVNLAGLTQLTALSLESSEVTDTGLARLKGLANLQRLDLEGTNVTDAGLECVRGLTKLQVLWLERTKVTDAGVKDLQKALPNCTIVL